MIDADELVAALREGLEPLVRDGLIGPRRADERSRNQAQAVLGLLLGCDDGPSVAGLSAEVLILQRRIAQLTSALQSRG